MPIVRISIAYLLMDYVLKVLHLKLVRILIEYNGIVKIFEYSNIL